MPNRQSIVIASLLAAGASACAHQSVASRTVASRGSAASGPLSVEGDSNPRDIRVVGDFTSEDLDAIKALARREQSLPLLSIVRRNDDVEVDAGSVCGEVCGGGNVLILRKVDGRWTVVERAQWIS
jgi:hypothetical protein